MARFGKMIKTTPQRKRTPVSPLARSTSPVALSQMLTPNSSPLGSTQNLTSTPPNSPPTQIRRPERHTMIVESQLLMHKKSHSTCELTPPSLACKMDCSILQTTPSGQGPLHAASAGGHTDTVEYLVNQCHADPMLQDKDGNTPLHLAAYHGHEETVKLILRFTDVKVDSLSRTALHQASEQGHIRIVELLVDVQNCDPLCPDVNGATPLHLAAANGHASVVDYLLKKRDYLEFSGTSSWTPIHLASENGHLQVVQTLSNQRNCDLEAASHGGITPLHLAASNGHLPVGAVAA